MSEAVLNPLDKYQIISFLSDSFREPEYPLKTLKKKLQHRPELTYEFEKRALYCIYTHRKSR